MAAMPCYNLIMTLLIQISYPYLVGEEMMMSEVFFQCLIAPINGDHLIMSFDEGWDGEGSCQNCW